MKRIGLYLGCPPDAGGAFQYSRAVLGALAALPSGEFDVVVAHSQPAWYPIVERLGDRVRSMAVREGMIHRAGRFLLKEGLPPSAWHGFARFADPLARRLLSARCDAWLFPGQEVLTYALPTRTIGVVHDLMHLHESRFPEVGDRALHRRREQHYRNLCSHARVVLVDSNVGKSHVVDAYGIRPDRVRVLPYVAPDYIGSPVRPTGFDQRYDLPARYFFYPAQFWQHKNHERLVEALAIVRQQVPDVCLVLVGSEKNALAPLQRRIRQLGVQAAIRIYGYVPDEDVAELYRRARALVMPTFFGPTNIPPLEAMACGCPMALSRIYAMPEQVGDAALWFDPSSVPDMAAKMLQLATDDEACARLSAAGLARSREWGQAAFNERLHRILGDALEADRVGKTR